MPEPLVVMAEVREQPLSVDEVLAAVHGPAAGAVALFVGMVRDHDHGAEVTGLDYSAHPSASETARALAQGIAERSAVSRIAVVHRVGSLAVGDLAIVAAVSAAHRSEAFTACRELVDGFKATVPIWKHQLFSDGTDEWVGTA